eukprot:Amastigsp_a679723_664.p1 type:complete len:334 gc:universal Amastigsp_a679723_664:1023-22(-)
MADPDLVPSNIPLAAFAFALQFHPTESILAAGLVNGFVDLYRVDAGANTELFRYTHHSGACRDLAFSADGAWLYTVSSDQSVAVLDVGTCEVAWQINPAHETAVNCVLPLNEQAFATADDDGVIQIWDTREPAPVLKLDEHEDVINGMVVHAGKKMLVTAGGDGFLGVFNLRKGTLQAMSDNMEEELCTIALMRDGDRVVCGTQSGVMDIFTWGDFGDISDRYPAQPSFECALKIDEDTLITGASDGLIRLVGVLPNRVIDVVGEHPMPVEALALSPQRPWLVSSSHDSVAAFWGLGNLRQRLAETPRDPSEKPQPPKRHKKKGGFFSGLAAE